MSESNSPEILKRKRGRNRQQKVSVNATKYKLIPKRIKLGKKRKTGSRQINAKKSKPIKKRITYKNYPQSNIDSLNQVEKTYLDEEKEFKKDVTCQENSLGQLTKNFIKYIKTTGKKSININDLVNELSVKKRRIYDITNVLQGIGYLQKSGKNEIIWAKTVKNKKNSKKKVEKLKKSNNNCNTQKSNREHLEQENSRLDEEIKNFRDEFNSIARKSEFLKYGYVAMDDLRKLSINNQKDLYVIKASKGTVMNILDKNDIISLLFYFGYLTIDSQEFSINYNFRIPNKVISKVYGQYYLNILSEYNIITKSEEVNNVVRVIENEGKIDALCEYISLQLKQADNRIYIDLKEKDIQIMMYAILNNYNEIDIKLEYPTNDNYIDIMIFKNNYVKDNILIELKYIKKKEYTEKIYNEKLNDAKNQITKYLEDKKIKVDKKYIVIFMGSDYNLIEV